MPQTRVNVRMITLIASTFNVQTLSSNRVAQRAIHAGRLAQAAYPIGRIHVAINRRD